MHYNSGCLDNSAGIQTADESQIYNKKKKNLFGSLGLNVKNAKSVV